MVLVVRPTVQLSYPESVKVTKQTNTHLFCPSFLTFHLAKVPLFQPQQHQTGGTSEGSQVWVLSGTCVVVFVLFCDGDPEPIGDWFRDDGDPEPMRD